MFKIKSVEDIRSIQDKIIGQLVLGKFTYFSLAIGEEDEVSSCFFSPITHLQGKKADSMIMVEDYEKLLAILLSHPFVSDIEYDEKNNVIHAIFKSPYPADRGMEVPGAWR